MINKKFILTDLLLFGLVVLTRLPFLFNGFGAEEDSWGLVLNANAMSQAGHYLYSRLPGHPLQEMVYWMMPMAGPLSFNLLSALFAAAAVVLLHRILIHYGFRYPWLAAGSAAMLPVFYISSVSTIDYAWALAFILGAFLAMLKKKSFLAGVMLGLAVGCRLTSALMLIPLVLLSWEQASVQKLKSILWLSIAFIFSSALVYLPALLEYGFSVFSTYRLPYPPLAKVIYKGSIGVFGLCGLLALLIALIFSLRGKKQAATPVIPRLHRTAWIVAILLNLLLYLRLPEKSAFLLPAVPFLILLIEHQITATRVKVAIYVLFLLSPFILGINLTDPARGADHSAMAIKTRISGQEIFFDPVSGAILEDRSKRINKAQYVDQVERQCRTGLTQHALVIAGWWYNQLMVSVQQYGPCSRAQFTEFATEEEIRQALNNGEQVYYLREIDRVNDNKHDACFTAILARPFPEK